MEIDADTYLDHFGTKGMKWGVRNDRDGVSKAVDKMARKDAEEFARAKLFYGDGAGNRRKLIKATVESRKSKDPDYTKAFDKHLGNQDMSTHATKAARERSSTDRRLKTKQQAGYFARKFTGEMGTQAAFAAVAAGGAAFLASPRGRAMVSKTMNQVKTFQSSRQATKTTDFLTDYFNRNS